MINFLLFCVDTHFHRSYGATSFHGKNDKKLFSCINFRRKYPPLRKVVTMIQSLKNYIATQGLKLQRIVEFNIKNYLIVANIKLYTLLSAFCHYATIK